MKSKSQVARGPAKPGKKQKPQPEKGKKHRG